MTTGVLYISYSGMLEPLGQSQVLAYQEYLVCGHPVHLISFERPDDWADVKARDGVANRMKAAGIHWYPHRYHKNPSALATAWDILWGAFSGLRLVSKHNLTIVHARSYVPSVMALIIKRLAKVKYIFDMRGFWADERVDGGLWPQDGLMYRLAKWLEKRFLLSADHVVSLTHAAVNEMVRFDYLQGRMPPVTVIPTCADLSRFCPLLVNRHTDGFILGYVGTAGTWYLFDAVAAVYRQLLRIRPDARLLIINRNDHDYIRGRLDAMQLLSSSVEIKAVMHKDMASEIARMDAGIFFYKPSYSLAACSPTKLGELLGCGIPCLSNCGVGDMVDILEGEKVGVALDSFDEASLERGLHLLLQLTQLPDIRARCVAAAEKHFSLDEGVRRYEAVYQDVRRNY